MKSPLLASSPRLPSSFLFCVLSLRFIANVRWDDDFCNCTRVGEGFDLLASIGIHKGRQKGEKERGIQKRRIQTDRQELSWRRY